MIDWQTIYFITLSVVFVPMVIVLAVVEIIKWRKGHERKTKPAGSKKAHRRTGGL